MESTNRRVFEDISSGSVTEVFDVLGPTLEFLTWNDDIVSGTQQVLIETDEGTVWVDARAGDHVRVTGSALHAHRNVSATCL